MSSMPWVKLYTEMLDDPKLAELSAADKWGFVQLILLAGECDKEGLIPMTIKQISWRLREPSESLISILDNLSRAGLVTYDDNGVIVLKFSKRQDRSQSVKRGQWKEAQQRHRTKQSNVIHDASMTNTPVILTDRDKDRDKEEDRESHTSINFDDMRKLCEQKTGYPIPNSENDIKALDEFVRWGVIPADFDEALSFFSKQNLVARGPFKLRNSIQTAVAKRTQKTNGQNANKEYVPEEHASEVYGGS